jgi:hypothetical protein
MKKHPRKNIATCRAKDPSPYPKGWNRQRVQKVIDYYDDQSDDEAIAEAEAAYNDNRKLLARRAG